eukprot:CAMPEP_0183803076 /NCGR_PEP_ID=MMETSP0803_2-20130417/32068_1 /TAXON_ID=195967 /ORGANISM="Crustomastix stigmata, Strain CCMP3273" /LENGTH=125 /DNA_ID=CAMNT_0026047809 /DNA_START=32 /DNA_END=409 /DNA_ORIENTATION=+
MSGWDAYISDEHLQDHCTGAAIVGKDGGVWASNKLNLAPEEIAALSSWSDPSGFQAGGIKAGGTKYIFLSADGDDAVRGKSGATGIVVAKTQSAVVIGVHDDGATTAQCYGTVCRIADYMKGVGF